MGTRSASAEKIPKHHRAKEDRGEESEDWMVEQRAKKAHLQQRPTPREEEASIAFENGARPIRWHARDLRSFRFPSASQNWIGTSRRSK
jgi:hypothetical protein